MVQWCQERLLDINQIGLWSISTFLSNLQLHTDQDWVRSFILSSILNVLLVCIYSLHVWFLPLFKNKLWKKEMVWCVKMLPAMHHSLNDPQNLHGSGRINSSGCSLTSKCVPCHMSTHTHRYIYTYEHKQIHAWMRKLNTMFSESILRKILWNYKCVWYKYVLRYLYKILQVKVLYLIWCLNKVYSEPK